MVTNLRNMAVDMGNEIESQNKQLDRINQKVGHSLVMQFLRIMLVRIHKQRQNLKALRLCVCVFLKGRKVLKLFFPYS